MVGLGGLRLTLPPCNFKSTMKVIFKKAGAPIGFGYHENEVAELSDTVAKELIDTGYVEPIEEIKTATEAKPKEVKKAVKK